MVFNSMQRTISMEIFNNQPIAGMNSQLEVVLLEIFLTKLSSDFNSFGDCFKQSKGMIIHGPPGTGKTLLARVVIDVVKEMADVLVQTISGPQLFDKMYGESEKKI